MTKFKTNFYCQHCGYSSPKWLGKCPSCFAWNSFVEEIQDKNKDERIAYTGKEKPVPKPIDSITYDLQDRFSSGDEELDRVLGGGIVSSSMVLIGGEPGIGKSTLMLQMGLSLKNKKIFYISGEESEQQIRLRAERLEKNLNSNFYLFCECNLENILHQSVLHKPDILIIDSIQTLFSSDLDSSTGSVSQIRHCTAQLLRFAKETKTVVFLIGHITKDGFIAGPKILEHMVDAVLQFEGDRHLYYRILRTTKNRFGSTSELGIYEMKSNGLCAIKNPSEILISQRDNPTSGIAIAAMLEGNRCFLVEIQSLVSHATYGNPQRVCTGFDPKRLNMLLAVLEKRVGLRLANQDVFLNVAGGIRIEDPAVDLAVCASIFSSYNDFHISDKFCFSAEVGLGGEIRAVHKTENRILEAAKMGMKKIFISKFANLTKNNFSVKTEIHEFSAISEFFNQLQFFVFPPN